MTKQSDWMLTKGSWISKAPVLPGVWRRKEGGHAVRARVTEATTGLQREIWKLLPEADEVAALAWLREEQARVRAGVALVAPPKTRFSEFASSLLEAKIKVGDIRSAKGKKKWGDVLEHLISGTTGKKASKFVPGFGDFYVDKLHLTHIEAWKLGLADLIDAGDYAPTTVNGWIAVLKVIMKAAKRQHGLLTNPAEDVAFFDLSEHETYTEEQPNSLLPEEVGPFLAKAKELHPAHFAMIFLGLVTGLRPSSLRPLRHRGPEADVLWDKNRLLVRRSHTVGVEIMKTTKQRRRYPIDLPQEVMDVLRWHVDTQHTTEMKVSELLFPSVSGGFRSPSVLNKPLAEIAAELGLEKRCTQCGLRRTYNDLARAAQVSDLVTRSISGHQTERMQHHYSSVNAEEQRTAIAKVIQLFGPGGRGAGANGSGGQESGKGDPASGQELKTAG